VECIRFNHYSLDRAGGGEGGSCDAEYIFLCHALWRGGRARYAACNATGGNTCVCARTQVLFVLYCIAVAVKVTVLPTPSLNGGERRRAVTSGTDIWENGSIWFNAVAWSFDVTVLATGGNNKRTILCDEKKGERLTEWKGRR
jgi:hypothetical protein